MRTTRMLMLVVGGTIGVGGCAGRIARPPLYAARYGVSLAEVARTAPTRQRYGATTVIVPSDSSRYKFEDDLLAVQVGALPTAIHLDVRNKTDRSIKLIWDEASFIDLDGVLSRVMHIGVKFADRNGSQPATVIPGHQRLADDVYPTDRVWYRSASPGLTAGWQNGALLKPTYAAGVVQAGQPMAAAPDSFTTAARARVGRRFAVVLPFEADGVKNEYTFWFRVDDVAVKALGEP